MKARLDDERYLYKEEVAEGLGYTNQIKDVI